MYVSRDQKDWDKHLAAILFGYRVSPHGTTGESPLFLLYGREPGLLVDVSLLPPRDESNSVPEHRARVVQMLEEVHAIARENIQRAQQRIKDVFTTVQHVTQSSRLVKKCGFIHLKQRKVCRANSCIIGTGHFASSKSVLLCITNCEHATTASCLLQCMQTA